jgi:hypothetical protein
VRALALATCLALQAAAQEPAPYPENTSLTILKPEDKQDVVVTPPPSGALVLFDGTSLEQWVKTDGKSPAGWKPVAGSAMQVMAGSGSIMTRQKYDGHFKLHLEFRVPYLPSAKGQARGNSGVYLQGRYEVQILDSYGLDSKDNDCGGIYEVAKPRINACKAPTIWQCYDIDFHAPRFADGKKVEPARISVLHNGISIHDDVLIPVDNTRSGLGGDPGQPGPIMLQDHGNPVQYRNIWLLPLSP